METPKSYMTMRHYRRIALEATAEKLAEEIEADSEPVFMQMARAAEVIVPFNDVWGDAR